MAPPATVPPEGRPNVSIAAIRGRRSVRRLLALCIVAGLLAGGSSTAVASGPNIVAQWDKIAEDTVVGSGAQQIEALIYLSYTQTAVYDAVVAIRASTSRTGRHSPHRRRVSARRGGRGRVSDTRELLPRQRRHP
jgi:hypothetical protein